MKLIKNKFLIKLIASICLFLTLLNFAGTSKVYAENEQVWGGVLINPIVNLMTAIGDTVMEILHESVQSQDAAIIKVDGSQEWYQKLASVLAVIAGILAAVVIIIVVVAASGGVAAGAAALAGGAAKAAFITAAGKAAGGALLAGVGVGIVAGVAVKNGMIPDDMYLPAFTVTAEEIFRNDIALFDVNFFNPNEYSRTEYIYKDYTNEVETDVKVGEYTIFEIGTLWEQATESPDTKAGELGPQTISIKEAFGYSQFKTMIEKVNANLEESGAGDKKITEDQNLDFKIYAIDTSKSYSKEVYNWVIVGERLSVVIQEYRFDIIDKETNELKIVIVFTNKYTQSETWRSVRVSNFSIICART